MLLNVNYFKNESGCKAGDKCLFPHQKVDEQPNKTPEKGRPLSPQRRKRRQKCSGSCGNLRCVVPRKTQSSWILKEANKPGETRCKKSWDRFQEYDSLGLRYVKQVSGKRKDHHLEKYKSKILISEVPTV